MFVNITFNNSKDLLDSFLDCTFCLHPYGFNCTEFKPLRLVLDFER